MYEKVSRFQRDEKLDADINNFCIITKVETVFLIRAFIGWPFEKAFNSFIEDVIKDYFGPRRRKFDSINNQNLDDIKKVLGENDKIEISHIINSLLNEIYDEDLLYYNFHRDKMTIRLIYEYDTTLNNARSFLDSKIYKENGVFDTKYLVNLIYRYKRLNQCACIEDFFNGYTSFISDFNRVLNRS